MQGTGTDQEMDRRGKVSIMPQILFHTYWELKDRGISLTADSEWKLFGTDGFLQHNQRLTFLQSQTLILRALELTQDPDLGLTVGARQSIASLGVLAIAMMACPHLKEAIDLGLRFHRVIGTMLEFEAITDASGDVTIKISTRFAGSPIKRFLVQEAMMTMIQSSLSLSSFPNPVRQLRTTFTSGKTHLLRPTSITDVFEGAEDNAIVYKAEAVQARLRTADPFSLRASLSVLEHMNAAEQAEQDVVQAVEAAIIRNLPKVASVHSLAGQLGTSERSLRRVLSKSRTSPRRILENIRLDRARQRIAEGTMSQAEIAFDIGYEDARSLRRLLKAHSAK